MHKPKIYEIAIIHNRKYLYKKQIVCDVVFLDKPFLHKSIV